MTDSTISGIGTGTGLPVPVDPTSGYKDLNYKDPNYWANSFNNYSTITSNIADGYQTVSGAANRHMLMAKAKAILEQMYAQADANIAAIRAGDPGAPQQFEKDFHILNEVEKAFNEAEQTAHSIAEDAISKASRS